MKRIFCAIAIVAVASCSSSNKIFMNEMANSGATKKVSDSVFAGLQRDNDLVIAFGELNFAWVRNEKYAVLCKKGNEWKGYSYYHNMMPAQKTATLSPAEVNASACDSLLAYITANKAWNIKPEDPEQGRCPNGKTDCNITDASSSSLWLITKNNYTNAAYYAPAFFEECCPGNEDRKLFLIIGAKVQTIVTQGSGRVGY